MNCKPGDLAVVVGSSKHSGKLVEVLYAPPVGVMFTLPDGYPHLPEEPGVWVIKILGRKLPAPVDHVSGRRGWRLTEYGCAKDSKLRPLRGGPVVEEHDEEIHA